MLNPLSLCGEKLARRVDSAYIDLAQAAPGGFGAIYAIGNAYRKLPWRSPVYFANGLAAEALGAYLRGHPVDAIVMTHLYPAEMLTYLHVRLDQDLDDLVNDDKYDSQNQEFLTLGNLH